MRRVGDQTFGALPRGWRRRAGLTQEELAERAEISARGLGYLEQGTRLPHRDTARRLAEALGLSTEEGAIFTATARTVSVRGATSWPHHVLAQGGAGRALVGAGAPGGPPPVLTARGAAGGGGGPGGGASGGPEHAAL